MLNYIYLQKSLNLLLKQKLTFYQNKIVVAFYLRIIYLVEGF